MNYIIDTNKIIAALVRNGLSRNIILLSKFKLFSPDFSLNEISKHKAEILEKSEISEKELDSVITSILEKIKIINQKVYSLKMEEARKIIGKIDVDDIPFIALALSIENDGIWTDDAHFDKQGKIKIWKTKDIYEKFISDLQNN